MKIVNLTPHALHIRRVDGTDIVVEPSGTVPRLATHREPLQSIRCDDGAEIAVSRAAFGALTGMPIAEDGCIYVVSALCAQSPELQGRTDVYAPGEAIRDGQGNIVGSQGLSYIAPLFGTKKIYEETGVFAQIDGLKPVDPAALEQFKQAMTENVIPEIVKVVEQRRKDAADSRHRHAQDLRLPTTPETGNRKQEN